MEVISEELVDKAWQEVGGLNPDQANKEMIKLSQTQPDLLAFMVELTEELDQEARELGIYLFFVVYRMFHASGKKIKRIPSKEIIKCYEDNENLLESLEGANERFLERSARSQVFRQPNVMKYVVDALMDDEDSVALTEYDKGLLFLLLKTVVDVHDRVS